MDLTQRNRMNAQHSTGPRSPEGKARSRLNGFRHGLAASTDLILSDMSPRKTNALVKNCQESLALTGPVAAELARGLVAAGERERKIEAFEAAAISKAIDEAGDVERYAETKAISNVRAVHEQVAATIEVLETSLAGTTAWTLQLFVGLTEVVLKLLKANVNDLDAARSAADEVDGLRHQVHGLTKQADLPIFVGGLLRSLCGFATALSARIKELEALRARKIEDAKRLAQIPDETMLKRIEKYRSMNERSVLRKLEMGCKLKELMMMDAKPGFALTGESPDAEVDTEDYPARG